MTGSTVVHCDLVFLVFPFSSSGVLVSSGVMGGACGEG